MTIGQAIHKARRNAKLDVTEFGRLIGFNGKSPGSNVAKYENDERDPSSKKIKQIEAVTGYRFCTCADGWEIVEI